MSPLPDIAIALGVAFIGGVEERRRREVSG
jgi:hypothetical protein